MLKRMIVACGALGLLGLAACEIDDGSEVVSYTDSAGRSCTVDLGDISLTATCDADPAEAIDCTAPATAQFVVYDSYDFDTMISIRQSCPACVNRDEMMSFIGDPCATVECATDADCLNREGDTNPFECSGGVCMR